MSIGSRPGARSAQDDVLLRSIAFAGVQRIGIGILAVALVACGPHIGWMFLAPLAAVLVVVGVLKLPAVQWRFGAITSWLAWTIGLVGSGAIVAVSDGPIEYLLPAVAIPTVLGSSIHPPRTLPLQTVATALVALAAVEIADPTALRDRPATIVTSLVILTGVILLTAVARLAETDSYLESHEDPLTGASNRVALIEFLAEMPERAGRWTLILGDVDGFKAINDTYGHAHGDRVLRAVADYLTSRMPDGGRLYRFGGEEFLISIVGDEADHAHRLAEEVRAGVSTIAVDGVTITMSFGVASTPVGDPATFDELFAAADSALYEAKAAGRDAVRVARPLLRAVEDHVPRADPTAPDGSPGRDVGRRTAIIHDEVEREQLVDVMQRQLHGTRIVDVILIAPLLLFTDQLGWLPIAILLPALIAYRTCQHLLPRLRTPEHLIVPAWLAMQAATAAVLVGTRHDVMWALSVMALLVVVSSAAVPWRVMRWGAFISAGLMMVAALIMDRSILHDTPQAVAAPLGLLLSTTIVGREIGRRILTMRRASMTDALTGLPNRTAFDRRAGAIVTARRDTGGPVGLLIGDIDHFKEVNDRHGHHRGDNVLVATAARLQSRMRHDGSVFRVGGEEFCAVLTGLDADGCGDIAERLREAIAAGPVAGIHMTMSFGVAVGEGPSADLATLYNAADRALYRAKAGGRDRVVIARDDDFAIPPGPLTRAVSIPDASAAPPDPPRTGGVDPHG